MYKPGKDDARPNNEQSSDALPGLLAQIALIGAPATLIALFCGVLNVFPPIHSCNIPYGRCTNHYLYLPKTPKSVGSSSSLLTALLVADSQQRFFSITRTSCSRTLGLLNGIDTATITYPNWIARLKTQSKRFGSLALTSIYRLANGELSAQAACVGVEDPISDLRSAELSP